MKPQKKELCKITFTPKGDYDSSQEYEILDIVNYNKCTYLAKCNVPTNTFVTNKDYWMEVYLVEGTSNGGVGMLFYNGNNIGEIFNDYGNNKANGNNSHVEGKDNTANGMTSHVEGWMNTSYGDNSHIEGYKNQTLGNSSHVEGKNNVGEGVASHCSGEGNKARYYCETVLGCYAEYEETIGDGIYVKKPSNTVLRIGNGDGDSHYSRNDCFRITFKGNAYAEGTFYDGGADYAEMFEWNDGNESNEDRVGYFVTLIGNKIIKANTNSKYILGIISANPSIVGNNPIKWKNKHLTDEWGRIIYETVEKTIQEDVLNENGIIETITKTITIEVPKINPDYNNEEYIMRSNRKEWDAVGMLGALKVRQDGTLTVGEFCYPNADGIATKSESGYYVTKIINENIAEVIFK